MELQEGVVDAPNSGNRIVKAHQGVSTSSWVADSLGCRQDSRWQNGWEAAGRGISVGF